MKNNEDSLETARHIAWLHGLYRMGLFASSGKNPKQSQQQILEHIVTGFESDGGCLALCCEDDNKNMAIVAEINLPQEALRHDIKKGQGVIGTVASQGKPVLLNSDGSSCDEHGIHGTLPFSSMYWPLKLDERVFGVLAIIRREGKIAYTEKDLKSGEMVANLITIIIENTQLHIDQKQRIEMLAHLNETNLETNVRLETARNEAVQSRQQLDRILNSLDNIIWSIEPYTFKTLYLNPAMEKVYGRRLADFFANPNLWLDSVHPDDREFVSNSLPTILEKGVLDIQYRIIRPDGELRWIHDRIHTIFDDSGKPLSLNGLGTDVTSSRQAEIELKKSHSDLQEAYRCLQEAQSQLLQSEKLASIGQLAAGVAHEINNPIGYVNSNIGSLQGYIQDLFELLDAYDQLYSLPANQYPQALADIQALKNKLDLDFLREDALTLLNESREGISRVTKIVQDLKDFSRAGSEDDWQWANLIKGIDSTLNIVWNEIKYKAEVKKDYGQIPDVECLPSQLNQVIMNLLVNAAHAIEETGVITIKTRTQGDNVAIEVADNGSGILPENINKIFDPFFTTKPIGSGTGLGLSISYSIIKKHHGSINVTSEPGKGTTFTIVLPISQSEAMLA